MATVYLALLRADQGFRKLVALKVLRDHPGMDNDGLREMFAQEARVSARCHHRNVVQIHDVCDLDGKPALCMEYLDGQTYRQVRTRAAKTGSLPLYEQVRILAETAHGLHHVHTLENYDGRPLGLVHCDVSPENVFITYDGQVKLLDFGIARSHGDRPPPTGFRGKLSYVAPELIRGGPIDARADVFALGAMLWEAASVTPFSGGPAVDDLTKVRARLAGGEANIRGVQPSIPEALATIIDRALALDPTQRFPDAETFACALEECLLQAGSQPSAQTLSKLIAPMFERERLQQRLMVEPQLQLADQWDREHEAPLAPEAQRDEVAPGPYRAATSELGAPLAAATAPSRSHDPFSYDPSYASPADSISPEVSSRLRANSLAVLTLAAALGVLGGVLLAWGHAEKSGPVAATLVPGTAAGVPAPSSAAPAKQGASLPSEPVQAPVSGQDRQLQLHRGSSAGEANATSEACVTTTSALRGDLLHDLARDLVRAQAREERHRERRARRRAAQCAAGRIDKC